MANSRKKEDPLRVKGEAKAKFQPKRESEADMHTDPIPDEDMKHEEKEQKQRRITKKDSQSEPK